MQQALHPCCSPVQRSRCIDVRALHCVPAAVCRYMEAGFVVVPAIEEPPVSVVRCMRADLLQQARLYDHPVWSDTSSDNPYWQCSVWQVDNACSTFVAVKSNSSKPHPRQAVSPSY